jgi:arylsulfatase A-like enzyme
MLCEQYFKNTDAGGDMKKRRSMADWMFSGNLRRSIAHLAAAVGVMLVLFSACTPASCEEAKPNVVLLVIDALRPDHLGCYGSVRPTSPTIDNLAAVGIVFETAVGHAPWTKSSFSSMLTSLYPFQHGVTDWPSVLPDTLMTLAEALAAGGYSTACVMNTPALGGPYQILQGFDEVIVTEKEDRDAFKTSADAIELASRAGRPFFLMVHFSDVHSPYRPPIKYVRMVRLETDIDPYAVRISDGTDFDEHADSIRIARNTVLYDACIRLADDGVGVILDYLDEAGLTDNTLVILTADHGEAFWEHGKGFHAGSTYEEVIRVPLIVSWPKRFDKPARIPHQARHIDILPTILEIAGIQDDQYREGISLVDVMMTGRPPQAAGKFLPADHALCECTRPRAPATRCIRTNDWKLIFESLTSTWELYDLRKDPGETADLAGEGLAIEDSLMNLIVNVPGVKLGGWRIALTGAGPHVSFDVSVVLPQRAGLSVVKRFAKPPDAGVEIRDDRKAFDFRATGQDLNPLFFTADPPDTRVKFKFTASGKDIPPHVLIGESGEMAIGEEFIVSPQQAMGLPQDYLRAIISGRPGAYVWWFPGEGMEVGGETVDLTPEQMQRLRALGYIQ